MSVAITFQRHTGQVVNQSVKKSRVPLVMTDLFDQKWHRVLVLALRSLGTKHLPQDSHE